jgi:hypothetical protein
MSRELVSIEAKYADPPAPAQRTAALGLRGGAAVLMVASFEQFLKDLIIENLEKFSRDPAIKYSKMPDRIRVYNAFGSLEKAMKGPINARGGPRSKRLPDILTACKALATDRLIPSAFIDTGANPNRENVKEMLRGLDLVDVFSVIKSRFERSWGMPVSADFIADKLDEVVNRRHEVAHTGQALNISRRDLGESMKFLRILAEVLDICIRQHCQKIARTSH